MGQSKPDALDPPEFWTVWRIDDNGNTFVVREQLKRGEAERLVVEFAARGHKQMYWMEREAKASGSDVALDSPESGL
jgi:hypothetical protein